MEVLQRIRKTAVHFHPASHGTFGLRTEVEVSHSVPLKDMIEFEVDAGFIVACKPLASLPSASVVRVRIIRVTPSTRVIEPAFFVVECGGVENTVLREYPFLESLLLTPSLSFLFSTVSHFTAPTRI